ncbi:MAG: cobalamin biosynthesis protein [Candidatus Limiplasma sp.]|nr:cobalamin biosynthesis protein [Candidatus Limiplasma sp.]
MNVGIIAFSERGHALGQGLAQALQGKGHSAQAERCGEGGLAAWTQARFASKDALVFIGSAGIAVRAVAPHVRSKAADPAVVVVDDLGKYSISLLSGHLGGANDLAVEIAALVGAAPVITTATDLRGIFAVDTWAKSQGLAIANPGRIKRVSARLLAGEALALSSGFPIQGAPPQGIRLIQGPGDIAVSWERRPLAAQDPAAPEPLHLVPPAITLGVGCKKGTDAQAIESAFARLLESAGCHPLAVARVCSIDLKARETGLVEFCRRHGLPLSTFSARELAAVPGAFTASAFVQSVTGVDNVCERSAILGGGPGARLLAQKHAAGGVTMALALGPYPLRFPEGGEEEP